MVKLIMQGVVTKLTMQVNNRAAPAKGACPRAASWLLLLPHPYFLYFIPSSQSSGIYVGVSNIEAGSLPEGLRTQRQQLQRPLQLQQAQAQAHKGCGAATPSAWVLAAVLDLQGGGGRAWGKSWKLKEGAKGSAGAAGAGA